MRSGSGQPLLGQGFATCPFLVLLEESGHFVLLIVTVHFEISGFLVI
jgi:hypothetical protein